MSLPAGVMDELELVMYVRTYVTKHIDTLCGQNVEFADVIHGGTYMGFNPLNPELNPV